MQLRSWFTCTTCILHVCHNSQRWSIHDFVNDGDLTKDLWVCCEALSNSQHLLLEHLSEWIAHNIKYEDTHEDLLSLWQLLGLTGEWLDMACNLQVRWQQGQLCVAARLQDDPNCIDQLVCAIGQVFRFHSFSTSRWCGVSETSRCLIGYGPVQGEGGDDVFEWAHRLVGIGW